MHDKEAGARGKGERLMKSVQEVYREKLRTPEEAVRIVKSGDWVDYAHCCSFPIALDEALAKRKDELTDVNVHNAISMGPVAVVEEDPDNEAFTYNLWHCSARDRKYIDQGKAFYVPMLFRNCGSYYLRGQAKVDVAMVTVTEMDRNGNFSYGLTNCCMQEMLDSADVIILEVNKTMPFIFGIANDHINIREEKVKYVVESPYEIYTVENPKVSESDRKIAANIFPYLRDEMTLQLGIGGTPNALGELIAESDLRDLGMHTELMSDGYLALYKAGKITNRMKADVNRRKGVFSICNGSRELYDFLDYNIDICSAGMDYVNDPAVISSIANFVSINSCISADLYVQVCAEAVGTRQISGTGGQLDFVTGAYRSPGGMAFITLKAARTDKNGVKHSNIKGRFTEGDIITTPRTQAPVIVTEYGAEDMNGLTTWERAEKLIGLADPDFREELIREAEEQKVWRRSNKR